MRPTQWSNRLLLKKTYPFSTGVRVTGDPYSQRPDDVATRVERRELERQVVFLGVKQRSLCKYTYAIAVLFKENLARGGKKT